MSQPDIHEAARVGYAVAAEAYVQSRPSFPADAVDWLLAGLGTGERDEVVEVGAGTGKFTALLAQRGVHVVAVEPVAAMRAHLAELPGVFRVIDAVAEKMPFVNGSVRFLIASQSLHWADVERAFVEFDRVLDGNGAIGLIWNFRDVDIPWQKDLDALLSQLRGAAPHSRDGRWQRAMASSPFHVASEATWRWSLPTDANGVIKRVRSVSYVAALAEREQQQVDERVREILAAHDLDHGHEIQFPYVTEAYVLRIR